MNILVRLLVVTCLASGPAAAQSVEWIWSGAVTANSVRVNARISQNSSNVRLLVSLQQNLSSPLVSDPHSADLTINDRVVSISMAGLEAGSQYYYALQIDGTTDQAVVGRYKTFPSGPASFRFALGSCAETGSNHAVFNTIRGLDPLFFLHMGDMHYENIGSNNRSLYRAAFNQVITSASQSNLYRNVPIVYLWDDHDYGPSDADGTAPGRQAARLTYQEYVPHYPLPAGSGNVPIYQSFSAGRVRMILTDNRSERTPNGAPDNASKTMLGAAQKTWFKQELLNANGNYPVIIWMCGVPWISAAATPSDQWAGYSTERAEIAHFIEDNGIRGLFIVAGDTHMLAIDDGTNSNYGGGAGPGPPVFHAAALDRPGSVKGGPYSEGTFPGGGQFGLVTITDTGGDSVGVAWEGLNEDLDDIVSMSFKVPASPAVDVPEIPDRNGPMPDEFRLTDNFPNPFNPSTTIKFELPSAVIVSIRIYNVVGGKVATLLDGASYPAGSHSIQWEARDDSGKILPAGVYICRLQAATGQTASKRLLLLK